MAQGGAGAPSRRIATLHSCMLVHAAERAGVDVAELLADVGLAEAPDSGATTFFPRAVHEALYEAAVRRTGDPLLCLAMGEVATAERFDLYSYALRSVETIGDAMDLATQLHRRTSPHLWFEVERRRSDVRWVISPTTSPEEGWARREIEYILSGAVTAMNEIAGKPVPILEVRFGHPPGGPVEAYEKRFRAPVRFGHERNEIRIPVEAAGWRSPRSDPALAKLLAQHLGREIGTAPSDGRVGTRARSVIEEKLGVDLDEAAVASELGMPVRTFQHRLRNEGTSYSAMVDEVRRARALRLIADSDASISEVSFALGYRDVRSFHRAFRRWTGSSPAAYRKANGWVR